MKGLPKMKVPFLAVLAALVLVVGLAPSSGHAAIYTLADGNATVNVDPSSPAGISNWVVDGKGYNLFQEWFWYRLDNGKAQSIDTISSAPVVNVVSPDHIDITYTNAQLQVSVDLTLSGGSVGSGATDLAEQIKVNNVSGTNLALHFFEYTDFDLAPNIQDQAKMVNQNAVDQYYGNLKLTETSFGKADRWEINTWPNTVNNLNGTAGYNLAQPNTVNNPNLGFEYGPADLTWALQWDKNLSPTGSFILSKDKELSVVPVPPSAILLGSGLLGLGLLRYRRKSSV